MHITWFSQNTVFSFLLQVYHDVRVTTINSIAKKYFCHYTYDMYSYVAIFFFCFQSIEFEENFVTSKRTIQQTVCCLVILQSSYKHSIIMIKNVGLSEICYD